jgi:hypothetical protein
MTLAQRNKTTPSLREAPSRQGNLLAQSSCAVGNHSPVKKNKKIIKKPCAGQIVSVISLLVTGPSWG